MLSDVELALPRFTAAADYTALPASAEGIKEKELLLAGVDTDRSLSSISSWRKRWRRWMMILCALVTLASLAAAFVPRPYRTKIPHFDIQVNRTEPTSNTLYSYTTSTGASLSIEEISWPKQDGKDERTIACHMRNVCIQQHRVSEQGLTRFWLMGDFTERVDDFSAIDRRASDAFKACFGSAGPHRSVLGIKDPMDIAGEKRWLPGTTFAVAQGGGETPVTTDLAFWSRFLSVVIAAPQWLERVGITHAAFVRRIMFLHEASEQKRWSSSIMATTLAAARASLPGGPFSKTFHPGCTSHHSYSSLQSEREIQPEVFLRKALETDKNEGAVCFESLAGLHAKSRFFRDNTDAAYWRQWSLSSVDLPLQRSLPCERSKIKVLLLLERDMPFWRHKDLERKLAQTGVTDLKVMAITDKTILRTRIDLLNAAEAVVTTSGNHVASQVYMQPGAVLIEVFPTFLRSGIQRKLAWKTGVQYVGLETNGIVPKELVRIEYPQKLKWWTQLNKYATRSDQCQNIGKCRRAAKQLGGYVDQKILADTVENAIQNVLARQQCIIS